MAVAVPEELPNAAPSATSAPDGMEGSEATAEAVGKEGEVSTAPNDRDEPRRSTETPEKRQPAKEVDRRKAATPKKASRRRPERRRQGQGPARVDQLRQRAQLRFPGAGEGVRPCSAERRRQRYGGRVVRCHELRWPGLRARCKVVGKFSGRSRCFGRRSLGSAIPFTASGSHVIATAVLRVVSI